MSLDLQTLFAVTVFATATAGGLLLFSWVCYRHIRALAFWGIGFLLGSAATALITARGGIPDVWSIQIANAVLATAYGVMWAGVRNFEGRRIVVPVVFAGAALWLIACQIDVFYATPWARVSLMAAIVVGYTILNVSEFLRGSPEYLGSRWPIIVLLVAHAGIFMVRIPMANELVSELEQHKTQTGIYGFLAFETIFHSFCVAFLLGSMARERIGLRYRRDSLIDPLTGIHNRRAFLDIGERLLRRARGDGQRIALLMFDLDRFKQINDRFGHAAGDRVLTAFCRVATDAVRPTDILARLGGEEFACLMPNCSMYDAVHAADRIREAFQALPIDVRGGAVRATVSAGVAIAGDGQDLAAVLIVADRALYRAKAGGRNRVEPPIWSFLPVRHRAAAAS